MNEIKDNVFKDLVDNIRLKCGFNFIEKKRDSKYVEARSIMYKILKEDHGFTFQLIADKLMSIGYDFKLSSVRHGYTTFSMYYDFSEYTKNLYLKLTNKPIDSRLETELQTYIKSISSKKHDELLKVVKLRVSSWEWKSKDLVKEYSGN